MIDREYKSLASFVRKRLKEAKSQNEIALLFGVLVRIELYRQAEAGDCNALIKISEEIWGTKND